MLGLLYYIQVAHFAVDTLPKVPGLLCILRVEGDRAHADEGCCAAFKACNWPWYMVCKQVVYINECLYYFVNAVSPAVAGGVWPSRMLNLPPM